MSSQELANKVIAVTGAGKGIGRACALHLASRGARVIVNNRRHAGEARSSADATVQAITNAGGNAIAEYSSVEDETSGTNLLDLALDSFGRLDGVVANAGVTEGARFRDQSLDDFRRVIDINLLGTVNVLQPIFRHLCKQEAVGSVVVCTSSAGLFGEFGLPAYSTSKAAVVGLVQSLSQEGARRGVHVNAIAPYASTQMTAAHLDVAVRERLQPADIAPVVSWLIGDACTATGEVICCGGGLVSRACVLTTEPQCVPDSADPASWAELLARQPTLTFRTSHEHFADFLGRMKGDDES